MPIFGAHDTNHSTIIDYTGGSLFACEPGHALDPYKIMFGLIIFYFLYIIFLKPSINYGYGPTKNNLLNIFV